MTGAPTPLEVATAWELHPGLTVALIVSAGLYVTGAHRARRWPRRRTAAFLAGLAVLAASLQSGLDAYGEQLLAVHMVQHLALTLVAPPLLLLGAPVTLALRTLSHPGRRTLGAAVTSGAARTLAAPAAAWALFVVVLLATHFTPFYDAALRSEPLHGFEHLLYLAAGLILWLPVAGADPVPRSRQPAIRLLYLLLAMPPMALVGVALVAADQVRYPAYLEPARALGVSALADQHAAGMVMWLGGSLVVGVAVVAVGWAALQSEERRQLRRESYAEGARR